MLPELEEFKRRVEELRKHELLAPHLEGRGWIKLADLDLDAVATLARDETAYYFLIAAAGLNRTSLRKAVSESDAQIVARRLRRAYAIKKRLPVNTGFEAVVNRAVALREADLGRRSRGLVEMLFRERLRSEGIPIVMSPPQRQIPGLLIGRRKPDGTYPDPKLGLAPRLYLEIKNVQRVADDIQKRLYEIAEASLEMKFIYGDLQLRGLAREFTTDIEGNSDLRAALRAQIVAAKPVVVALLLCPKVEAERYREGAEAFVDRVFFQEEIDACLSFLASSIKALEVKS